MRCRQEGETLIGSEEYSPTPDIVLAGAGVLPLHCRVSLADGVATISPAPGAQCWLNTVLLDRPAKLSQGEPLTYTRTLMIFAQLSRNPWISFYRFVLNNRFFFLF